ncbi:hypothetical protein C2845_PM02G28750 [Panicum miliaceum]|uniref:Complex III subunit 9 n=1 Tax=Panicum miliaceum TaxID=4540 RepID=A0A3L6SAI4_PANMI|nr:hypothetical protein C2845_PM02G28750 [Panicum miliaceum]
MGLFDALYRVVMRRNAVYVTFVVAGAFAGERAVDYGVHKLWEMNNVGIMLIAKPNCSHDSQSWMHYVDARVELTMQCKDCYQVANS